MSPQTLKIIFDAVRDFGMLLAEAFRQDDPGEVRRLADVLPEPLRSRVALQHQEEITRKHLQGGG